MNLKRPNTDLAPPQRNDPRVRHSRPLKPRAFLSWGCQRYFIRTFLRQWFSHHFLCSVINMCPCCNFSRDRCLMLLGKSDETRCHPKATLLNTQGYSFTKFAVNSASLCTVTNQFSQTQEILKYNIILQVTIPALRSCLEI